jgi:hypothetical protein
MSLVKRLVKAAVNRLSVAETDELQNAREENRKLLEELEQLLEQMKEKLNVSERRSREYFGLIERVLAQRDQWHQMFNEHAAGHINAQAVLEGQILVLRQLLINAMKEVNDVRKEKGLEPLSKPLDLWAEPIGTAEVFKRWIEQKRAQVPQLIDGKAERDRIAKLFEKTP